MYLNNVQKVILTCLVRSEYITDVLKLIVLSYLFYKLCWDFDYFALCADIEFGISDYKSYSFEDIKFTPSPAAMSGKRKEKNVSTR